jgi:hypothetical protein
MQAAAHNPEFAKKAGISQKVAKEFNQADKGKKFNRGGNVSKRKIRKFGEGGIAADKFDALAKLAAEEQDKFNKANPKAPEYMKKAPTRSKQGEDAKYQYEIDKGTGKAGAFKKEISSPTYKKGGKVTGLKKIFKGKETYKEELKEGKAIKSGKISPEQYAKGEAMEKKMKKGGKCYAGGGAGKSDELRNADIQREMANQTRVVKKAKGDVTRADGCVTKGHTKGKFV